jgi:hypothetical protein
MHLKFKWLDLLFWQDIPINTYLFYPSIAATMYYILIDIQHTFYYAYFKGR